MKILIGWLNSFVKRNNFTRRRVTTTAQKPPENYADAVAKFVVHVEERKKVVKFVSILAMDETAVWFDCPDNTCIKTKGAKDVTVMTTGHEKMIITVCLTARSDGKKLLPYVLVHRKRPVQKIVEQFKGKIIINWNGSVWMNDKTTANYLKQIISRNIFFGKRLFGVKFISGAQEREHVRYLEANRCGGAFIPEGCTEFIQVPDVSWNKPIKVHNLDGQ